MQKTRVTIYRLFYVNPSEKTLTNAKLKVEAYHKDYPDNVGQINKNVTKIKIYQAPKDYVLNKGYDVNTKSTYRCD
ncbi:fibrinogen-binding adhesin SdrG C-terminal domain-containing protein [Staphylococcus aureus]|nr:fibrinogen-binding adhesin SdrG C-terminal domain-containing protein [Staphylococcus aureus]